jgi:DNA-binding IclR family transcriptional regulator
MGRLRSSEVKVFQALTGGALTAHELEAETGLPRGAVAEALARLVRLGAVERVIDYTMGPRRVRWRRLVDEAGLRWIITRRVVDPLLDEFGVSALEAILDAVAQRPELLSHLKAKLGE